MTPRYKLEVVFGRRTRKERDEERRTRLEGFLPFLFLSVVGGVTTAPAPGLQGRGKGMARTRTRTRTRTRARPGCVRKLNSKKTLSGQQGSLMKGGLGGVGITGKPVEVMAQQDLLIKDEKKLKKTLTATEYYDRL